MAYLKQINNQLVQWEDLACTVRRNGFSNNKKEGDGCTPTGTWKLLNVYYRPDKVLKPNTLLPVLEYTLTWVGPMTQKILLTTPA
jgi:L,D-peptidoglycan transpeptidase YkuD (ErfK/YbiS/YcfS/YnhG family)